MILLVTDSEPYVNRVAVLDSNLAKHSRYAVKRIARTFKHPSSSQQVYITQTELNGISSLVNRALPEVKSEFALRDNTFYSALSAQVPYLNRYVNVTGTINDSNQGLVFENLTIGPIVLSGSFAKQLVQFCIDFFIQPDLGKRIVTAIKKVQVSDKVLRLSLAFPKDLFLNNDNGGLFGLFADKFVDVENPEQVYFYIGIIERYVKNNPFNAKLTDFIQQLFVEVAKRAESYDNLNLVAENQAALLALVLYFGDEKFSLLTGFRPKLSQSSLQLRRRYQASAALYGRIDLQKHFLYSVGIQLLSNVTTSDAVGEFKELLDSNRGGSGFSFVDLLADRAGTRLAQQAIVSQRSALKIISLLSQLTDEQSLLPSMEDLPEGLTAKHFQQRFKDIDSEYYKKVITDIDQRLDALPLYQTVN